jgi:hypothetical protein
LFFLSGRRKVNLSAFGRKKGREEPFNARGRYNSTAEKKPVHGQETAI